MNPINLLVPIAHAQTTSPVAVLGLNWQLFIAQLVNFLIVLFVLWKWVFTPVSKMLQQRTDRIDKALKDAAQTDMDKSEFEKWKQAQIVETRREAQDIIGKAQNDAVLAKDEILKQAKEEQLKLVESSRKQIEQEKNQAVSKAKTELADIVTQATEKILREKMNSKKDEELIKEMLKSV